LADADVHEGGQRVDSTITVAVMIMPMKSSMLPTQDKGAQ
jgi:hypothetical protein